MEESTQNNLDPSTASDEKANPVVLGIVVVLVLVALVLGYFVVFERDTQTVGPTDSQPALNGDSEVTDDQGGAADQNSDESGFSPAEEQSLYDNAVLNAVAVTTINVANCEVDKKSIRTSLGDTLTLENTGNEEITISFDEDHRYVVPANGSLDIIADFGKGPALYGYGCNLIDGAAGSILVTL